MLRYTNIRISVLIGKSSLFILSAYTFGLTCHKARGSQTVGRASLTGELLVPGGGGRSEFLYEGHIYFEQNMDAR
jgi:hypothetical protein